MSEWLGVCALDDIPVPGARRLQVGAITIALIRPAAERVYALEDVCPHKGGPLSEGIVSADRVSCPLHAQCVDLESGCMVAPDEGQVKTFAVRIEAGRVHLDGAEMKTLTRQ